ARLHRVESLLTKGGGGPLFVGRCTAGIRVVLPGLAGMLGLRYRVFAAWTGAAATLWAVAHVLLGFAPGASWRHVDQLTRRGPRARGGTPPAPASRGKGPAAPSRRPAWGRGRPGRRAAR